MNSERIFISYTREHRKFVADLAERLRQVGAIVFVDHDLEYGKPYPEALKREISSCDFFVLVVSKSILDSEWVPIELQTAFSFGKRIIPVVIEEVDEKDPRFPIQIASLHQIDGRSNRDVLPDLLRAIGGLRAEIHVGPSRSLLLFSLAACITALGVSLLIVIALTTGRLNGRDGREGRDGRDGRDGSGLNPGTIASFGGAADRIDEGWLLCDGREFDDNNVYDAATGRVLEVKGARGSRPFAELRSRIEESWGDGSDGKGPRSKLPDLRGMFLRGANGVARKDGKQLTPEDSTQVGTYQFDMLRYHHHLMYVKNGGGDNGDMLFSAAGLGRGDKNSGNVTQLILGSAGGAGTTVSPDRGQATEIGDETRPKNAAVNWIIKY